MIEEVVTDMPQEEVFSVLDATSGYWQVKLDEASSKLCTFNTPFGIYRFTRLPFGIKSAPEVFQNHMTELFTDVEGVKVIVDDLLVWGKDDEEHDARPKQKLTRAREVNLKFNAKKCKIKQVEVPNVGHVLSKDGFKPDPEKIRAVKEMKPPENVKELKTFLGFIQCLGKFMPNLAIENLEVNEVQLTAHLPISQERYSEFQQATAADPTLQALSTVVRSGWPCHKQELPLTVCEYWSCGDEISEIDGLLFKAQKYIVPQSKRKEMLELIHESHQGILKCKQRARDILFWPGMSYQIEEKVSQCSLCVRFQKAQPREPMIIKDLPDRMWSKVGTDLFEYNGIYYILCVDYYSKWIELAKLDNLTSDNVICHLKSQFSRYGKPDELISDNGPQYPSSAFSDFSKSYGFLHATSSPHFPQANGEAERADESPFVWGGTSSPGCANLALKRTAEENQRGKEKTTHFLTTNFYVDDGLMSTSTVVEAVSVVKEAREMCAKGGFKLHKFISNNREVLESLPAEDRASGIKDLDLDLDPLLMERVLGVEWCVERDSFKFKINLKDKPVTRRGILSIVSSVYDPFGMAAPLLLRRKRIFQHLCKEGIDWDDPVPDALRDLWETWKEELHLLEEMEVRRCFKPEGFAEVKDVQLHHFSDASTEGYIWPVLIHSSRRCQRQNPLLAGRRQGPSSSIKASSCSPFGADSRVDVSTSKRDDQERNRIQHMR
ncbi:Uncharacterized protein K02A2.6 [Stylophora pistillata]|uniref:Uncharacterized protein K02A2.6 n=1 Tax=Stylophora pistillata TaxID=50429 RepID=A0A2B4RID8_STYPI|nr:Uncharacterized protein K02A2.6 [Stylophora pistillata]